jgi:hypothetical protein
MNYASKTGKVIGAVGAGALLLLAIGCMTPQQRHDEFMTDQQETLPVDEMMERQATAGAAQDATLNSSHFDGNTLNELGRTKLNAIVQQTGPSTVYVNVTDNGPERIAAVTKYLKDAGATSDNIKVESGPNPKTKVAAVEGLKRMQKTESVEEEKGTRVNVIGVSPTGMSSSSNVEH